MFDFFSILGVFFSILIPFFTNPIYSILSLILSFFCSIMILFYLKIEFLSLVYLLVYIGAIPILFLFILLMFPIYNFSEKNFYKLNIYFISLIKLYIFNLYIVWNIPIFSLHHYNNFRTSSFDFYWNLVYNDIFILSHIFYTYYFILFLSIGLLLFFTMIGAIIIVLLPFKYEKFFYKKN